MLELNVLRKGSLVQTIVNHQVLPCYVMVINHNEMTGIGSDYWNKQQNIKLMSPLGYVYRSIDEIEELSITIDKRYANFIDEWGHDGKLI